jgi:hypothetical protein
MLRSGLSLSAAAIGARWQLRSRSDFVRKAIILLIIFAVICKENPAKAVFTPEESESRSNRRSEVYHGRQNGGRRQQRRCKMRNKSLMAALFGGVFALAGPALAQGVSPTNGTVGAIGGENILGTTPADNMPLGAPAVVTDRVVDEDGTVIESRRYVDNNGNVVVNRRALETDAPLVIERYRYYGPRRDHGSFVSGGVGGAIGGEGIIGTTPADNAPLPYQWRYR